MSDALHIDIHVNKHNWNGQAAHMRSALMTWEWRRVRGQAPKTATIDFRDVEFMEPWAIAMFASYAVKLRQGGTAVEFRLDPRKPSNRYIEQIGLPQVVKRGAAAMIASEVAEGTGLRLLSSTRDTEIFAEQAAQLLINIDEHSADRVRYCVQELGRNAIQHADSTTGACGIAQRFPKTNDVQIAICDVGRGVRASLKPYYPEVQTDLEALRLAVLPRTSGASPRGVYGGNSGDEN